MRLSATTSKSYILGGTGTQKNLQWGGYHLLCHRGNALACLVLMVLARLHLLIWSVNSLNSFTIYSYPWSLVFFILLKDQLLTKIGLLTDDWAHKAKLGCCICSWTWYTDRYGSNIHQHGRMSSAWVSINIAKMAIFFFFFLSSILCIWISLHAHSMYLFANDAQSTLGNTNRKGASTFLRKA